MPGVRRPGTWTRALAFVASAIASAPASARVADDPASALVLRRADGASFATEGEAVCPYAPSEAWRGRGTDEIDDGESLLRLDFAQARPLVLRVRTSDGTVRTTTRLACDSGCSGVPLRFVIPGSASVADPEGTMRIEARFGDVLELALDAPEARPFARVRVGSRSDANSRCAERALDLRISDVRADPDAFAPSGVLGTDVENTHALLVDHAGQALEACGIVLRAEPTSRPIDPPPPFVLAVAEGDGLPARGGEIRFVAAGRRIGPVTIPAGSTPAQTAELLAEAVRERGFRAEVRVLPRLDRAANPAADLLVLDARGEPVTLSEDTLGPSTTDPRQSVRIGRVDLADGLDEFDADRSLAGTLEERTLLHPLVRRSGPRALHLVLVDAFTRQSRLGESFVPRDQGPLVGFVVLDRRGIAADPATWTLAHEIGHVLLDDPFHPALQVGDPPRVMGSDSGRLDLAVARAFTREECNRMRTLGEAFLVSPAAGTGRSTQ